MNTETKSFRIKKRMFAIITLIMFLLDTFSPYSILLKRSKAEIAADQPYFIFKLREIDDINTVPEDNWSDETWMYYWDYNHEKVDTPEEGTNHFITIDIIINGGTNVNTGAIGFSIDQSKLIPAYEENIGTGRKPNWIIVSDMTGLGDFTTVNWPTKMITDYDSGLGQIRIDGSSSTYLSSNYVCATMNFALADGVTIDDITKDCFTLVPGVGISKGLEIDYFPDGKVLKYVEGKDYLVFEGFAAGAKSISGLSFKSEPSKNKYYAGEALDFTGAVLTVNYDDGSSEELTVSDALSAGTLTASATTASKTSKKTSLTYQGESIDFNYYVLDSIAMASNLTNMDYEHDDIIDFAGGQLEATYVDLSRNELKENLNISNGISDSSISVNRTKADVNNKAVTFSYHGLNASLTLNVTDPVASIRVSKQPTTQTYSDGETINLAGGEITPVTKSGQTLAVVATDSSTVTASTTLASIATIPQSDRWAIAGGDGLQAGHQKITLTYEGKTADIEITVNDTVSGISITNQPTAKNKYGTLSGALDFTGLVATVTTSGGGSFTVGANSLTIDKSSYNPNSLTTQSFPVRYGTISSTNNIEIQLSNYITGITASFTKTEYNYDTSISTVLANGNYVEQYADGTTSSPKAITSGMVTGYNQRPAAADFAADHTYTETLTIKLSTSSNSFDQLPASCTQTITIKDYIKNISMLYNPTKTTYNYGDTFVANGGQINVNFASGTKSSIALTNSAISLTETDDSPINMRPAASSFTDAKTTKRIKVTYTNGDKTYETNFDIIIKDEVQSIAIGTNPKQTFNHGETFTASTGVLAVTYISGNVVNISFSKAVLSERDGTPIDMNPSGTAYTDYELVKPIKVTYGGKSVEYNITLQNIVDTIAVSTPEPKKVFNLNDPATGIGGTIEITRKAGDKQTINIEDSMVTGIDTTIAATNKTATIKYTDKFGVNATTTYQYQVMDSISGITIVPPSKTVYKHGEAVDYNGTITVNYSSGASKNVTMTSSMIQEGSGPVNMSPSSYDSTNKVDKTLTITYSEGGVTETVNYPITIVNDVKSISVHSTNHKTTYNVNDSLDVTNLEILVTRATGTSEVMSVTSDMVSGFNSTVENAALPLTITYTENSIGKTTSYNVKIADTVTAIRLNGTNPTIVKYGQNLNLTGTTIEVTKGSGTSTINVTQSMLSGFNNLALGDQTVTVTYGGQTDTFQVTVKDYVTKITVAPDSIGGTYNDELATILANNAVKYTVTYASAGDKPAVAVTDDMVVGYNKQTTSAQSLDVTYVDNDADSFTNGTSFTDKLNISLANTVTAITIDLPTKDSYKHGESLDFAGGKINLTFADATTSDLTLNNALITEQDGSTLNMTPSSYDSTNKVSKILKIKYSKDGINSEKEYPITIINDIKSITVENTAYKKQYNVNDTLDVTNLKILVTRAVGSPESIPVTESMISGFNSATENTALPLLVTYNENGIEKTTTFNVKVVDSVTSIKLNGTNPSSVKFGAELDLTGTTIEVTKGSGKTTVNVLASMISGYNKNTLGEQTVTVTYGGQTDTFKVTVKDYVTGVAVIPDTVSGIYNDELSSILTSNLVKYRVTYASAGDKADVPLTADMVSGYNKTVLTEQSLTVTYRDSDTDSFTNGQNFTTTLKVTLNNAISSIVVTIPTKDVYKHGESLDYTDGKVVITYGDGTTKEVDLTKASITESDGSMLSMTPSSYDLTNKVSKTLKITYTEDGITGTENYPITIINDIKSVLVSSTNHKKQYNVNDLLDVTNLEITVTRASGTPETIPVTSDMISGFNSATENTALPLTVTYEENNISKSTTFIVSVVDSVTSIQLNGTNPSTVKFGEDLNLTGTTIEITKGSGRETVNVLPSMISGFNKNSLGVQTVTVTYGGQTDTFDVDVKDYVKEIIIIPDEVSGTYNEELSNLINRANIEYKVVYASKGAQSPIALVDSMVAGYDKTALTEQSLTVTYVDNDSDSFTNGDSFTATLKITLANQISGIVITAPSKAVYKHGESLDYTDGKITINYGDGKTKDLDLTKATITEQDGSMVSMTPASYDSTNKVDKILKISYTEDSQTGNVDYPITIINDVKSIVVYSTNHKKDYNVNDVLDVTNLEILVTRASGSPEAISVTSSMVSGFNSATENTALPLTITYTENGIVKTATYTVSVVDSVTSIQLNGTNPSIVKFGEELNLTGTTIEITKGSGRETVNVLPSMISGFNKNSLGVQTVTVTYGGQTDTFDVDVKDYVKGITIAPDSITGSYNDELSNLLTNNAVQYKVEYASKGVQSPNAVLTSMITGYDKTALTEQNLTVTYVDSDNDSFTNGTSYTATLKVKLTNEVSGIVITLPTKTVYNHGEPLDLIDGKIELNYGDGNKVEESLSKATITEQDDSMVNMTPSSYDSTNKVQKTLKIKYEKDGKSETTNYPITIINDVKSVLVYSTNHKKDYNVNDPLDVTNLEIIVVRAVGSPEVIPVTSDMITGFDSSIENTALPLTITFSENGIVKTATYNVSIKDSVASIKLNGTNPSTVKFGEELDLSGVTIEITKGSGTQTIPVTSSMISGFDKNRVGPQTVTVTYGGKTDDFQVEVKDFVKEIIVNPSEITGSYKDELLNLLTSNNVRYTVVYASKGAQSPIALDDSMVTGYDKDSMNEQNLTVTYIDSDSDSYTNGQRFETGLKVQLTNEVAGISITIPTKTVYNHGESLNLSGGKIIFSYGDGVTTEEDLSNAKITEQDGSMLNMAPSAYDNTNKVDKTLKISYDKDGKSATANYPITIINDIKSVVVFSRNHKTEYNVNDALNVTNLEIIVTRASGEPEIIQVTSDMVSGFDSSIENTELPLTITYTENGISKTATYNVSVKDSVSSIRLNGTNPSTVKFGEDLDLSGATIEIIKGSGSQTIPVTNSMISGFDKNKVGPQTVTVTYGGKTDTFQVDVKDFVKEIKVAPSSVVGTFNDSLATIIADNSITYTVVYASKGAQSPIALIDSMVAGYDNQNASATQNLVVSYTDNDLDSFTNGEVLTTTLDVKLEDEISKLVLNNPPTESKYGKPLDLSSTTITITRPSGDVTIPVTKEMIRDFYPTDLGKQQVTLVYGGLSDQFEVEVKDFVVGMILEKPTKDIYEYGENLDLTGGYVQVIMASGNSASPVDLTDPSIILTGYDKNQEGAQTITVSYEGRTANFAVRVENNIQSIELGGTPITSYRYGAPLNLTGLTINATKSNGDIVSIPVTNSMVTGYDPSIVGTQELTVTYKDKTVKYNVTVNDYVRDIEITPPTKDVYDVGETINLTGGTVKTIMASGAETSPVLMTQDMISNFDTSTAGAKLVKVTYEGFSREFGIVVNESASEMSIKSQPNKLNYLFGESLDVSGGILEIKMKDGTTQDVPMTASMVSGYNPNKLGEQKLIVSYRGLTGEFFVTVEDYEKGLKVTSPNKTKYEYGEDINLDGGKVSIMMASGAVKETAEMTASMISGFDSSKVGTQTIKVTYSNHEGSFKVNVVDSVKGIAMSSNPNKTSYKNGENLDVSGAVIRVEKSSGTYEIPVTNSMVSGYEATRAGQQVITVNYEGFKTSFVVTVAEPEKQPDPTPEPTPSKPSKPSKPSRPTKPSNSYKPSTNNTVTENKVEDPIPTPTPTPTPTVTPQSKPTTKPIDNSSTKPTDTLGVKDTNEGDSGFDKKFIILGIAGCALLLLLILLLSKRNVKVFVEEDGELVLGGYDKLSKKKLTLNIDKFLDELTANGQVKIILNDEISDKLDGQTIDIIRDGQDYKYKVVYNDKPFEILLDRVNQVKENNE